jgi:hypothetical protein
MFLRQLMNDLILHSSLVILDSPSPMTTVNVKVVPGAKADRVVGRYGDGIKIQVSAPPEGGKANAAVVRVLAHALGVKPSHVQVLRGHGNPRKVVGIDGMDAHELAGWVAGLSS